MPDVPDVPDVHDDNALRAAIGASPLSGSASGKRRGASPGEDSDDEDDDDEPRRRNPRAVAVAVLGVVGVLGIAALVVLGYINSDRYVLACEAARAVPEQGRGFPPWGTRALRGEPWRPLDIAPETRCQRQETDDPQVLERVFLAMILDQATALLTAREVTRLDEAEALLKQALLLTRPAEHEPATLATQRSERHKEIERMLGDVTYWRATAKLRDAATALGEAAKQFDAATAQHPRHVSDAAAWAAYARRLAQEVRTGPAGSATPGSAPAASSAAPPPWGPAAAVEHSGVPAGVELPVEPDKASAHPAVPTANPPMPAAPPPDAGAPTGGVLL